MWVTVLMLMGSLIPLGEMASTGDRLESLERIVQILGRQQMMQRFHEDESRKASYGSGIKQLRNVEVGSRPYLAGSGIADNAVMAIHNHGNNIRTVGFGEFCAVLNGVEFRTRHNDYRLYQKSTTTKNYGATEEIEFPPVPPSIKGSVDSQIKEMREYFRAFALQDKSIRDYRDYFKPILCYLEGAWTESDSDDIQESFDSDRHSLDAKSWNELMDKVKFNYETGHKDNSENFAYLPTSIYRVDNVTGPQVAQWNFRILCHPLKKDLKLNRFRIVNDIHTRMRKRGGYSLQELKKTRYARFQLNIQDQDKFEEESGRKYRLLDKLMEQVPGYDGYLANLVDDAYDQVTAKFDKSKLNAGYYNRWYSVSEKGANGLSVIARGYADQNLFMALNTRKEVVPFDVTACPKDKPCKSYTQRISYAVPLEIIYLTPLSNWNPHGIKYRGDHTTDKGKEIFMKDGKKSRDGSCTKDKAYDGTNSKKFYRTPLKFFETSTDKGDADTTEDFICVLDKNGNHQKVRASGVQIMLPEIPGIGIVRQRYPIAPFVEEESTTWKEMQAIIDFLQRGNEYPKVAKTYHSEAYYTGPYPPDRGDVHHRLKIELEELIRKGKLPDKVKIYTAESEATLNKAPHVHVIEVSKSQFSDMVKGNDVPVKTSKVENHTHNMKIRRTVKREDGEDKISYRMRECDGEISECPSDKHTNRLMLFEIVN